MKLLIISAAYPPGSGGVATHAANLAHSFIHVDSGNESFVITTSREKFSKYSFRKKQKLRLHVWKFATESIDDFSGRRTPFGKIINEIMKRWHSISPGIIHVHDFDSAYIGLMLKTAFRTPLVFTYHRAPSPWRDYKFQEDAKDCFLEAAKVHNFFDFIVVPSDVNRRILLAQGFNRKKIKVIKHGLAIKRLCSHANVDSILTELKFDSSKKIILCPARFDDHKNPEVFIRAASILKKRVRNNKFIFVLTDDPDRENIYSPIRKVASDLGLKVDEDLFFKPFEFTQMATLYRNSIVCVIPSLRESFGQTVIESFIYKTPVIAANSGALPEIIKHRENGLLFTSNSHDELVERIQDILDDSGLRNRLVENALLDAERNYDSERMVRDYLELYKEVIKKKAACRGPRLKATSLCL
jgi:glycosyltransferase involved in cell wall biosynthesis